MVENKSPKIRSPSDSSPNITNQYLLPDIVLHTVYKDKKDMVPSLMDHPLGEGGRGTSN